jgi:cyclase
MQRDRRAFLKTSFGSIAGLGCVPLLGSLGGCQQNPQRTPAARVNLSTAKISDRINVISGAPGNVMVLNSGEGMVLVDSGSAAAASALQKSFGSVSVRTLFNTHYHADQTGGNALFAKAGAQIHAHTITKQWLAADYYVPAEDRWVKAPAKEAVPTVTFRGKGEMKAGVETIEFGYLLEAHTRGDGPMR